jgi:uncharacterized membrane protein (UPF0127 family)
MFGAMHRLLITLALLASASAAGAETCAPGSLDIRGPFGSAHFSVEIADDDAERMRGLMYRESLPASAGMLFVYDRPGAPAFWMKNTLIPLDMLFVTPEGVVQSVHSMARPGDLTPISGGAGVLAVLEIRGGLAAAIGIDPGSQLRHPAFSGPAAAWPCDGQ